MQRKLITFAHLRELCDHHIKGVEDTDLDEMCTIEDPGDGIPFPECRPSKCPHWHRMEDEKK